ncbi:glycerol kinase GlpK [Borrelia hermsii]|uniref:Glycerol kinase n=4 Tax=Borrelia hermsii TaxID=140 RepID=GLPK_BORHD|nr:glycerol kinase GlpK [Borrelia hermsii]B2RZV0.1 RecName: Full=Glycerol kinase; AltName: Full=ATP:glycerol 3-phosphotransferase; AltName: Full=Glycerokinase; Short=GK [Borrelia hermsii DAH]AAO37929.1 glycerol kinase [Borrelia hermsii DAH]AAX16756.1 glycerol kinase [Borrelia hermsii DAH]AJW73057.1 glycerol kinase [Borrelia hermsii CC1]AMR75588.1 Glycerol kinase [Borrelia hermsii]ANA43055.1 glycerol kinase [Borrelia hermsii HS1]
MKYILSLDQGTTSSRAVIFDKNANIKGFAKKEFKQIYPHPSWVEHDPNEIWGSLLGVMAEALANARTFPNNIEAIGITNQRETTIIWDRNTGHPIYNAIVWQDRRTAQLCDELKSKGKDKIFLQKTGLVLDAYFSGTKIKWILDNVAGARKRAEKGELCFGTIDTWIVWNLTKGKIHITDYSNASRTLLLNIKSLKWDCDLLQILDIPKSLLPELKQSSEVYGKTDASALGTEIIISGIAGDQFAATFGQACLQKGMAKNTYGTGCFVTVNIGKKPIINEQKILTSIAWGRKNSITYVFEGSVFIGGAVIQWLRDNLELFRKSGDAEAVAASVDNNGGIYFVPAFVGLGTPHWDPYARGMIIGLTRSSTKEHITRAALESIALQSFDVLTEMQNSIQEFEIKELRVDGGASKNNLLMQFQADILQCNVVRPKITETTALGSAYLAGLAVGYWESAEEITSLWKSDKIFEPSMEKSKREDLIYNWNKAIKRAKAWI